MLKKSVLLVFLAVCASSAATSSFGSWFKKYIADPAVNLYNVGYSIASNGVEMVTDAVNGVTLFTVETASNGSSYIVKYTSSGVRTLWQTSGGVLIYCGEEVKNGVNWVGSLLSIGKWYESQFKENTEGTADFLMDVGLDSDDGKLVGTQIFELEQFITSKNQFQDFSFRKAYATLNTNITGGFLS